MPFFFNRTFIDISLTGFFIYFKCHINATAVETTIRTISGPLVWGVERDVVLRFEDEFQSQRHKWGAKNKLRLMFVGGSRRNTEWNLRPHIGFRVKFGRITGRPQPTTSPIVNWTDSAIFSGSPSPSSVPVAFYWVWNVGLFWIDEKKSAPLNSKYDISLCR